MPAAIAYNHLHSKAMEGDSKKATTTAAAAAATEYKKGLWTSEEDRILINYIKAHGKGRWNRIAKASGIYIY